MKKYITVAACNHKDGNSYYNGLRQSYTNSYSLLFPDWYPEIETDNMFEI